jgi:hypothetical protein
MKTSIHFLSYLSHFFLEWELFRDKGKGKGRFTGPIQHCGHKADCTLAPEIVPSSPEALRTKRRERLLLAKEGNWIHEFSQQPVIYCSCWVLLHAPKLGHGADYLTSPPKEGMLRIFTSEKSNGFGWVWTRELGNQRFRDKRCKENQNTHVVFGNLF